MSPLSVTSLPNLVVGCGYLGRRVARRWLAAGRRVAALTRRNAERFSRLGLTPYVGDVLDPASLRGLPEAATLLYSVGLDRSSGQPMREVYVDGLGNVLTSLPSVSRLIYISSTSVYGQTDGGLVDESSPAEPIEESGKGRSGSGAVVAVAAARCDHSSIRRNLRARPTASAAGAVALRRADDRRPNAVAQPDSR